MEAAWVRWIAREQVNGFFARPGIWTANFCALLLTACGGLPLSVEDPPAPETAISPDHAAEAEALVAVSVPGSAERLVRMPRQGPVALLISSKLPAYEQVAAELQDLVGQENALVHLLDPDLANQDVLVGLINATEPRATVAIGLDAALVASRSIVSPVVFCQVFNYAEQDDLLDASAVVSVLPSFEKQLEIWQQLDSSLGRIGAIAGAGHEALVAESERAASAAGLSFDFRVSGSDQETVYLFKRMAPEIDGFWLLPDNRVLSVSAIREMLAYASEHGVQVLVSNPELLELGALISMTPSARQIAETVHELLENLKTRDVLTPLIAAPLGFDVRINASVARRFGLDLTGREASLVQRTDGT